jgi:hypothetical protein
LGCGRLAALLGRKSKHRRHADEPTVSEAKVSIHEETQGCEEKCRGWRRFAMTVGLEKTVPLNVKPSKRWRMIPDNHPRAGRALAAHGRAFSRLREPVHPPTRHEHPRGSAKALLQQRVQTPHCHRRSDTRSRNRGWQAAVVRSRAALRFQAASRSPRRTKDRARPWLLARRKPQPVARKAHRQAQKRAALLSSSSQQGYAACSSCADATAVIQCHCDTFPASPNAAREAIHTHLLQPSLEPRPPWPCP